ncbi:MAG: ribonuclease J [Actinomycetota bacterium]|nr:ribonuclease J [Actinomycetota bacterium]
MAEPTRVVFLGGLGEIGRNMIAFESGGRVVVIDAGLSFPTDEMLGVDLVLPDFSWVAERADRCEGIVLTHGHEDHVGALTWLLRDVPVPVYGTALTLGLARRRLEEMETDAEMHEVAAPGELVLGPFHLHFLAVSHSIPDAMGVVIDTSDGRILYTSDFKIDATPIDGRRTDLEAFGRMGAEGVDLMLSDSTNAETPGRTPSESIVGETLHSIFEKASGRIVVACFASNLHRIQQVCDGAVATGRKVALVGRSMLANVEVGIELGYLEIPHDLIVDVEAINDLSLDKVVVLSTGSQGEPLSALSLIAAGEHKFFNVRSNDTVILSASAIPGNESAVHRVINSLYREGAAVYYAENTPVHVSGHAAADELAELLSLVRPRHFVPVHGEFRQLAAHARIAEDTGIAGSNITIVEDGDVIELSNRKVGRGNRVEAGTVLVDGLGVGDVGPVVLRDRRHLAEDGILICVLTIDSQSGQLLAGPDLISRGFVYMDESRDLLDDASEAVLDRLEDLDVEAVTDWAAIKKACRRGLGEIVWERTRRRPMILPIIMEI